MVGHLLCIGTVPPSAVLAIFIVAPGGSPVGKVISLPSKDASTWLQSVYLPASATLKVLSPGTSTEIPRTPNDPKSDMTSQTVNTIPTAQSRSGHLRR